MLFCGRAAALARAPFWQPPAFRKLIACTRLRLLAYAPVAEPVPPPVGTLSIGSLADLYALDIDDDTAIMDSCNSSAQDAPAPKRQRTDDGPATNGHGRDGPAAKDRAQGGQRQHKWAKRGRDTRIGDLMMAVKHNDLQTAMSIFRSMLADGGKVQLSLVNSLLYLACGGEQWERYARGLPLLTGAAAAAAAAEGQAAAADGDANAEAEGKAEQTATAPNATTAADVTPPSREELVSALDELWSYAGSAGLQPDQGTYLGLARWEALKGDGQAALRWAEECGNNNKPVQLRLFHPAQVCYCLAADVAALERIDGLIAARGLDNTEYEFARLVEGITAAGSYSQMRAVLLRMQDDLNQLSPSTAAYITDFFERASAAQQAFLPADQGGCPGLAAANQPPAAAEAEAGAGEAAEARTEARAEASGRGAGERRWRVVRGVTVEAGGRCEEAGGKLRVIDLEDSEWDAFAKSIAELARKNMGNRGSDFDAYVEWFERNGPYDILVDAANVAFFGQNREGGGFSWEQIQDMYLLLSQRFPNKKILVMLHKKRLNDPEARKPDVQAFLERLRKRRSFYYTPPGANDDWFWLYACVKAKQAGLLVSNDELRDHIFGLLRPKHFLKWKARHIAHYTFNTDGHNMSRANPKAARRFFELVMPQSYTACVQQLEESGAWMLPVDDGSWICVRPE